MKLLDKVLILQGDHAGRQGQITALDQVFGYDVQLDDFSTMVHFRWPHPFDSLQVRVLDE